MIQEVLYFKNKVLEFKIFLGELPYGTDGIVPRFKALFDPVVDIPSWGDDGCADSIAGYILNF